MADVLAYLPAVVALTMGWYELRLSRRGGAPAWRHLSVFGLLMGCAMALLAPATAALADRALPVPNLAYLLGREVMTGALYFLALAALALEPPGRARAAARWHGPVTAAALVFCPVVFLAARSGSRDGSVVADGAGRAAVIAFDTAFALYSVWALALFLLVVSRHGRRAAAGPFRAGLLLVTLSAAVGLVWAAWGAAGIAGMALSGRRGAGQDGVAVALAAVCLTLGALGASAARWGAALGAPARRLRAHRRHRALEPLWSALRTAVPGIALAAEPPGARRLRHGAEFALYRRVIEIRDGYLALRPHQHPDAPVWARRAAERFGVPPSGVDAAVEAATLAAALESARAGVRHGAPPPLGHAPATLDAEVAWLLRVTEAFTRSDLVDHVRDLVRADLRNAA